MKTPLLFRISGGLSRANAEQIIVPEPGWLYLATPSSGSANIIYAYPGAPAPSDDDELTGSPAIYLDQPGVWYVRHNLTTTQTLRFYPSTNSNAASLPAEIQSGVSIAGTLDTFTPIRNQAFLSNAITLSPSGSLGKILVASEPFGIIERIGGSNRESCSFSDRNGANQRLIAQHVLPIGRYRRKSRMGYRRGVFGAPYGSNAISGTTAYGDSGVLHVNVPSGTRVSIDRVGVSIASAGTNPPVLTVVYTTAGRTPTAGTTITPVSLSPGDNQTTTSTWTRQATLPSATETIALQVALENKVGEKFFHDFEDGFMLSGPCSVTIKIWTNGGTTAPTVYPYLDIEEYS